MGKFEPEILLHGGEINSVVRVGETVRRTGGFWTPTIHRLLEHVRSEGFTEAPEPFGFDEQGREVLSFIDGEVTSGNVVVPDYVWGEATLRAAAKMLCRLHEATETFHAPADARWLWQNHDGTGRQVICHNDFAWWNVVFRKQEPVGLIDWDLAAPGPALADIAWALWWFVPLSATSALTIDQRADRIRAFCDSYGLTDRQDVMNAVRLKHTEVIDNVQRLAEIGVEGYRQMWSRDEWHEDMTRNLRFLDQHFSSLGVRL